MNLVTALALIIGLLGGLATFAFLSDFGGLGLQIWAAFIAWASFFHCGGKTAGFTSSLLGNLWGVLLAALTLIAFSSLGLGDTLGTPVWAGICVAIGVALMILGANIPIFSAIPAAVYGYAATAGFALLSNAVPSLTDMSLANAAVVVAISMIVGNVLGYISEAIAGSMASA